MLEYSLAFLYKEPDRMLFCIQKNEIPVSFFILWGLYTLLKMIKLPQTQTLRKFLIAGLIMGIGLGFKQTVITYCVASGLTLVICYRYLNKPIKNIFFFSLGGLVGYLIINGYFMYKYWVLYGNPFFPFLNNVFHSPYFFDFNYHDTQFIPSPDRFLLFPFMWNMNFSTTEHLEAPYYDFQLTLYYLLTPITFGVLLFKRKIKNCCLNRRVQTATYVFVCLSVLIWMALFSIMRYTVVIEAMGAIILVDLLNFVPQKKYNAAFCVVCFFVLSTMIFAYSPYRGHKQKHIDLQKIQLPENTLVKIYGMPTAFVIPQLARALCENCILLSKAH